MIKRYLFKLAGLCFLLCSMVSCNQNTLTKIEQNSEVNLAKEVSEYFLMINPKNQFHLGPSLSTPQASESLKKISEIFSQIKINKIKLISYTFFTYPADDGSLIHKYDITFQCYSDNQFFLNTIILNTVSKELVVEGFNIREIKEPLEVYYAFDLKNANWKHYLFLLLGVLNLIFILVVTFVCIKTPLVKRKWLWILFILTGFTQIILDCKSTTLGFKILSIQLLGIGFGQSSPYSPFVISLSIPLGAILFLLKRKKLSIGAVLTKYSTGPQELP